MISFKKLLEKFQEIEFTDDHFKKAYEMRKNNIKRNDIAKELNVSKATLTRKLDTPEAKARPDYVPHQITQGKIPVINFTDDHYKKAYELRSKGHNYKYISNQLGVSVGTLTRKLDTPEAKARPDYVEHKIPQGKAGFRKNTK